MSQGLNLDPFWCFTLQLCLSFFVSTATLSKHYVANLGIECWSTCTKHDKLSPSIVQYILYACTSLYQMAAMRRRKECPVCQKGGLLKLSNHLTLVHKITGIKRKHLCKQAKSFPPVTKRG